MQNPPKRSPLDSKSAGLRNERLVLALLRQHGELSQAELCKLANLSSSTASYIVRRLREKNLISERPGQSSKRGAKPVILSIDPRGQFVLGAEIEPSTILIGLFDFNCELVDRIQVPLGDHHSPESVTDVLEISLRGLMGKHEIDEGKLVGVGLTLSGSLARDGTVALSSPLGWKDVPLGEMVQARFDVPVNVYTTRVRLLAELTLDPKLSSGNILLLNFGNGVGASMVVDGHLAHGATNRAGELGHVVFDPDGPRCGCGHRGCLEAFISGPALAARIKRDLAGGAQSVLQNWVKNQEIPEEILGHWGAAIQKEDRYALELREVVAEYVSRAAAIAINCYDPDVVILAGYVTHPCPEYLIQAITKRIATDVYDAFSRDITVIPARAGEQALIRGVATAILQSSMEVR